MGFFWATSMLCHRSSLLFANNVQDAYIATVLVFISFMANVFTMITVAAIVHKQPEKIAQIPSWIFMVLPVIGISLYGLVNISIGVPDILLIIAGALLTGTGFGYFWGMWAETYGRIKPEHNTLIIVLNFIVAFGLWIFVAEITETFKVPAIIPLLFFMPMSWFCLRRLSQIPTNTVTRHGYDDYAGALRSLWLLILGASVMSFLFGYVWQLAVHFSGSVSEAHHLAMLGNLGVGVAILFFVIAMRSRINLNLVYRFLAPTIIIVCLVLPWFIQETPAAVNVVMSSGYGLFDIVIWLMVVESAYDFRVSGFVVGAIIRSISVIARLFGMLTAVLTINQPADSNFLIFTTFIGGSYLLVMWIVAYRRYSKKHNVSAVYAVNQAFEGRIHDFSTYLDSGAATINKPGELTTLLHDKSLVIAKQYKLSRRETEVLPFLLEGRSARIIAEKLFVSENTVRSHIRHILEKVGIRSKAELIDIANALDNGFPPRQQ